MTKWAVTGPLTIEKVNSTGIYFHKNANKGKYLQNDIHKKCQDVYTWKITAQHSTTFSSIRSTPSFTGPLEVRVLTSICLYFLAFSEFHSQSLFPCSSAEPLPTTILARSLPPAAWTLLSWIPARDRLPIWAMIQLNNCSDVDERSVSVSPFCIRSQ